MKTRLTVLLLPALLAISGFSVAQTAPSAEMSALEARLADLRLRYTDQHPDVMALLQRIEAQRKAESAAPATDEKPKNTASELQLARAQLADLRQRLTDKYPDVQQQIRKVKELEQGE